MHQNCIPPKEKAQFHAKLQVLCFFGCYLFNHLYKYGRIVRMSVLQEVKGLTKELYFIILLVGRPLSMPNFQCLHGLPVLT